MQRFLRDPNWDYMKPAKYLITLVPDEKRMYFGRYGRKRVELNRSASIVIDQVEEIEGQYEFVRIHAYAVLPDHVHLIIELHLERGQITKPLFDIIGRLKMRSSKLIRRIDENFRWSRSFHEMRLASYLAFRKAYKYVENNQVVHLNRFK